MNTELKPNWFTSSYSGSNGQNCVETAALGKDVGVRDTKDRSGGHLTFDASSWRAFVGGLKAGKFDLR